MKGRRISTWLTVVYLTLVGIGNFMLLYLRKYTNGGNVFMMQGTTDIVTVVAAITSFAGIVAVVVSQILFYKKDAQTMSEIKQDVREGQTRLGDKLDGKEGKLSAEHNDIRDIVQEIQLKQEMELKLQEKIKDIVPDAGMLKDGIDKMCRDNAELRDEVRDLKYRIEKLQEKNIKLEKSNKRLMKEIEREIKHSDDFDRQLDR